VSESATLRSISHAWPNPSFERTCAKSRAGRSIHTLALKSLRFELFPSSAFSFASRLSVIAPAGSPNISIQHERPSLLLGSCGYHHFIRLLAIPSARRQRVARPLTGCRVLCVRTCLRFSAALSALRRSMQQPSSPVARSVVSVPLLRFFNALWLQRRPVRSRPSSVMLSAFAAVVGSPVLRLLACSLSVSPLRANPSFQGTRCKQRAPELER
jgi:hypothetical protein